MGPKFGLGQTAIITIAEELTSAPVYGGRRREEKGMNHWG
jgi:hypothetical protein